MADWFCPRCKGQLDVTKVDDVEVEVCPSCHGIFLDAGELSQVTVESSGDIEFCTATDKALQSEDGRGIIDCPKCETRPAMRKVEFLSVSEIVLDHCDQCRGLWLDSGELDQVNECLAGLREVKLPWMIRLQLVLAHLPF